jgi:hypothetical protein
VTFLLLDECVAKCCANGATVYTAQRSVAVRGLGRRAPDLDIYRFVNDCGCTLVTLNGRDFATLAIRHGPIPVIVLPPVPPRTQHAFLRWVAPIARRAFAANDNRFVEVNPVGRAISFSVQRGFNWEGRPILMPETASAMTH